MSTKSIGSLASVVGLSSVSIVGSSQFVIAVYQSALGSPNKLALYKKTCNSP